VATTQGQGSSKPPVSLLLVEGDTDELFYKRIKDSHLTSEGCRVIIRNLEGLFNINKKVVNDVVGYCYKHPDELVRVYCCLDRESRTGKVPGLDLKTVIREIDARNVQSVLSINTIIATQQVEIWFFWDMVTIYKYLEVPRARRKKNAYRPPEKYTYHDMIKLFRKWNKVYNKGKRGKHFIDQLDLGRIIRNCSELSKGIELIKKQS
jgi:hypothetical protein